MWAEKSIVSVSDENERVSIAKRLTLLKMRVSSFLCGPRAATVTAFFSIYSRTSLQRPLFFVPADKNPLIDSCLKPLYNGHLFTTATFLCPQGGRCREVQLYTVFSPIIAGGDYFSFRTKKGLIAGGDYSREAIISNIALNILF